ncbi:hypothetical protein M409DRAFT_68620 [Zasmidium cellare ATCC 36951]|uniref:BTB domain-containing protein n=1 Tax=Zasmidium cellare ATCC 36951 TaxID=1080233 RepID=A0A6A6C952_ZASCE|nr:uncharacterized protein M409DRAFT_68620 [Zasmidium cellare ATCC 36951]KAF2163363.1 hypothetical protein M409DRAFT_68620 [Zasmidium cellare ATCC 36951]
MGERPRLELFSGLASLYQSREYSDLVLFGREGSRHAVHRAIVCPRSEYFYKAVKEEQWREGISGHIALPDDDEVVRLLVEYLYLLDYDPIVTLPSTTHSHPEDNHSRDSSDTMSIRTEAGTYGHVYGTSAVSAFGGPVHPHQHSPFSTVFRPRQDSSLTVHAMPTSGPADYSNFGTGPSTIQPLRRRKTSRGGMVTNAPEPSPLATKDPHLVLHARMYAAASTYSIGGLKALALDKFKIQLTRHWDSVELAEAIHIVYTSTPSSDKDMRETVADTLDWHSRLLDKPEIEFAVMEINGLAYSLLKRSRRAEPEYMD